MRVTPQWIEQSQAILNIEAEPEEMEESLSVAYQSLVKRINIPGFRKGKIPRSILEHYVGREALLEEALKYMVPQLYSQAIERMKIEAIAEPQVEILQTSPLAFKATVPLRPRVELEDYHQIRLTPEPVAVTEENVDAIIEQLRNQQAIWEPVERSVGFGDLVIIDVEGEGEGEPATSYQAYECPVVKESLSPMPGFTEQLVGMEKRQTKEFTLSYPADYDKIEELSGKQFHFKAKVLEIKEKHLPELNDEFAKSFEREVDTLDALREHVAINLRNIAEAKARERFENEVVEAVVKATEVDFPPILVEREVDNLLHEQGGGFGGGQKGLELYLKNIGKTEEELREELRPRATKRVTQSLILSKVAKEEKIEVDAAEVEAEIEAILRDAGERKREMQRILNTTEGHRWVEHNLILRKTIERLKEIASSPSEAVPQQEKEDVSASDTAGQ